MRSFAEIERDIEALGASADAELAADRLLALGEEILEHWIEAHRGSPTRERREGFRLLALHRQGTRGQPSFNACRETCRELAYHHNLIKLDPGHADTTQRLKMASMVAMHLLLFVSGKMQVEQLGEFCCSSRPLRAAGA